MTVKRYCLILAVRSLLGWATPLLADSVQFDSVSGSIEQPLTDQAGDASKGRLLVLGRQSGLCILCHNGPFPEEHFQGNLAPELSQSASRLTAGQLRAHLVAPQWFNPTTIMPSYLSSDGLIRVSPQYQGKAILVAQDIEDIVAFLLTLKP